DGGDPRVRGAGRLPGDLAPAGLRGLHLAVLGPGGPRGAAGRSDREPEPAAAGDHARQRAAPPGPPVGERQLLCPGTRLGAGIAFLIHAPAGAVPLGRARPHRALPRGATASSGASLSGPGPVALARTTNVAGPFSLPLPPPCLQTRPH